MLFYGRDAICRELQNHLRDGSRFLTLIGASGSGKTSIIHAGLIPALQKGDVHQSDEWLIASFRPGMHPVRELADTLVRISPHQLSDIYSQLMTDPRKLAEVVDALLPSGTYTELFLVVDQAEELFTLVDQEVERSQFLNLIVHAVMQAESRLRVLMSLRADFYHRVLEYADLAQLFESNSCLVTNMTTSELESAITQPAHQAGLTIEAGLMPILIRDTQGQPGTLPLLQFTLSELYEARVGNQLTVTSYEASRGISGSLQRRADSLYEDLSKEAKQLASQFFMLLVNPTEGGESTIRCVPRSELYATLGNKPAIDDLLSVFGRSRLLTFDKDPVHQDGTVQIAHESLIRHWEQLQHWIERYHEQLLFQRQLSWEAKEWISHGRAVDYLVAGTRLAHYQEFVETTDLTISHVAHEFLNACREAVAQEELAQEQRHQRVTALKQRLDRVQRIALTVASALLVISITFLILALISQNSLATQVRIASAHQLAALGVAEFQNPIGNDEYVALLAIRSLAHTYEPVGDEMLVRAFDQLPNRVLAPIDDEIATLVWSSSGQYLVAGVMNNQGTALILDATSGQILYRLEGHTDELRQVAISPNEELVLTASDDSSAILWEIASGQVLQTYTFADSVRNVAFSSDGTRFLLNSLDGTLEVRDTSTGNLLISINSISGNNIDIHSGMAGVFSPDGSMIGIGGSTDHAELRDAITGNLIRTFAGHSDSVISIAFSPDNTLLATGSMDNTARLWNTSTGELVHLLRGHSSSVRSVQFSPDGHYLLTGSADRTARLWNVSTGEEVRSLRAHLGRVRSAVFSPNGNTIMTASEDSTIKEWRGLNTTHPQLLVSGSEVFGVAWSHNNALIATGGQESAIRLWDPTTKGLLHTITGHQDAVTSLTFSQDNRYLLSGSMDGTARLWNLTTRTEVRRFAGNGDPIWTVALAPNGRYILTADNATHLWDIATGQLVYSFEGSATPIVDGDFSPDGVLIAAGGQDYKARVWRIDDQQLVATLTGHEDEVTSVDFSPDNRWIATGSRDATIRLWDTYSGQLIRVFEGHTNSVNDVAFTQDGQRLVSSSADRTARLWDVQTGDTLRIFSGQDNGLWRLALSPNDAYLVTAGLDGISRIWPTDYHQLIVEVCRSLYRDMTAVERRDAFITDELPTCS